MKSRAFAPGAEEERKSSGTADTAKMPTRRVPWMLPLIPPRLQALKCNARRLTASRMIRQKATSTLLGQDQQEKRRREPVQQ
jgi:hypothetical protein